MTMTRRFLNYFGLLALAATPAVVAGSVRAADAKTHRLNIHVGGGDVGQMNVALSNMANIVDYYSGVGQTVAVELVANGPGYAMLRDTSPVKDRIAEIQKKYPLVIFSACQNSRAAFAKAENKSIDQIVELPGIHDVPAGVVRITELQEQGWSYLRV